MTDQRVTSFLSRQAVVSETRVGTKAILTDTYTGLTARFIASFRGGNPTIAICYNREVQRWLALSYGVLAYSYPLPATTDRRHPVGAMRRLVEEGLLHADDRVAYLSGSEAGANSLEIDTLAALIDA